MTDLLTTALNLHAAGLSVVPVAADGSKRPRVAWKQYTAVPAGAEDVTSWFDNDIEQGIGIITGVGGIELLEVEGKAMHQMRGVLELLDGTGLRPLYDRILLGWAEQSPSGGLHLFYRITDSDVPGNTKVAQQLVDGPTGRETLAETRGTGGFVVLAPSSGRVHATGLPYVLLTGGPTTMVDITREERDELHAIFHAALDTMPEPNEPVGAISALWDTSGPRSDGDITPGDDYEARTDWDQILIGWTLVFTRGRTRYWRRPGKKDGISATTGHADDRDRLYVFTSSTEFEPETPYTKFGAMALLEHHGDHTAAARALASNGYGQRAERTLQPPKPTAAAGDRPTAGERTTSTGTALALLPADATLSGEDHALSEHGNALLFAAAYSDRLRYVPDAGKWVTWTGTRWEWQPDDGPAIEGVRDIAERLPNDTAPLRSWRMKSLAARAITNVVRLARADPAMRIAADQFDRHPWHLNTPGGIVDLRTADTAAPLPTLFHSKQTKVAPDFDMPTPLWHQFLHTTFQHDIEMLRYMQRLAGLMFIGEVLEHILPFAHGGGGNGKGVFAEVLLGVAGDYGTTAPQGFLVVGRDKHETELAKLQGRRLVVASEINEDTKFDEAKMKVLTGGDTITARFMRQDFFDFKPSHTFLLLGNSQPKVQTGGDSVWRRLRLIPFTHTVPEADRIENLQQRLVDEEGPGILAWIIQGAVDYARDGIHTPNQVLAATDTYRAEEDHLGRFLEDRCSLGGGDISRVEMADLRHAYDQWCREENEQELTGTAFGRQLKQKHNVGSAKSNGRRYYTNITLYTPEDEPDGDARDTPWWNK